MSWRIYSREEQDGKRNLHRLSLRFRRRGIGNHGEGMYHQTRDRLVHDIICDINGASHPYGGLIPHYLPTTNLNPTTMKIGVHDPIYIPIE
jgi:hypothetical protein